MHPDLVKLLALQNVDKEILRLHAEVAALPQTRGRDRGETGGHQGSARSRPGRRQS